MTSVYFDCFSGISGDMTVAALLDCGVPLDWLREQLSKLLLDGYELSVDAVTRNGIRACRFMVSLTEEQPHRDYSIIRSVIEGSAFPNTVKQTSLQIFNQVAEAESRIHGTEKSQVHFHEVGAADSIVDIVGTALCLDYLGIETVLCSHIPLGKGFIQCRHGTLPAPAPATLEILRGVPVYGTEVPAEIVTPTGAAIVKALAQSFGALPHMAIENIGYGAGKRHLPGRPNLLRVLIGRSLEQPLADTPFIIADTVEMIETTIDDMNPEIYGYLMERLFDDGALDVCMIPVFMKKNRPATLVRVLSQPAKKDALIYRILSETTSTGVRFHSLQRGVLERETLTLKTSLGSATVKKIIQPDGRTRITPEYDSCRRLAIDHNMPAMAVYALIERESASLMPANKHLTKADSDNRDVP